MEITERQQQLYDFITSLNAPCTQAEICLFVRGYEYNDNEKAHDHCPAIWNDINAINLNPEFEKIILQDNFIYKVASEEESKDYYKFYFDKAMKALVRASALKKKINRDGQVVLLGDDAEKTLRSFINE